ncbi:hypothetical protein, partial [Streptomyces sp. NPDC005125]
MPFHSVIKGNRTEHPIKEVQTVATLTANGLTTPLRGHQEIAVDSCVTSFAQVLQGSFESSSSSLFVVDASGDCLVGATPQGL